MAALTFYLPTVIFISLVGGFLPLLRELSQKALALLLSFSAGVLLGAVFFHMLPETGRVLSDNMGWPVLTGFLSIFAMERFVFVHASEERDCDIHQMGIPGFLGISLHSLLDGIALGAGLFCRSWVRSYFSQLWFTRCLTVCPFLRFCWPQDGIAAR